jgi:hypothetical protein
MQIHQSSELKSRHLNLIISLTRFIFKSNVRSQGHFKFLIIALLFSRQLSKRMEPSPARAVAGNNYHPLLFLHFVFMVFGTAIW